MSNNIGRELGVYQCRKGAGGTFVSNNIGRELGV